MSETPLAHLHGFGVTFHQTTPLKRAGHTTVEQVADLVAAHRNTPDASPLANVSSMGPTRITAVCEAVDRWAAACWVTA